MAEQRESWDTYFMKMAHAVASRSTCPRRAVGAVLVQDRAVRGTGYNGAPAGVPSCLDSQCLIRDGVCIRAVHAEANVILQTDAAERLEAKVYCTDRPCWFCANMLANSGVKEIIFAREYHRDADEVRTLLSEAGVLMRQFALEDK